MSHIRRGRSRSQSDRWNDRGPPVRSRAPKVPYGDATYLASSHRHSGTAGPIIGTPHLHSVSAFGKTPRSALQRSQSARRSRQLARRQRRRGSLASASSSSVHKKARRTSMPICRRTLFWTDDVPQTRHKSAPLRSASFTRDRPDEGQPCDRAISGAPVPGGSQETDRPPICSH